MECWVGAEPANGVCRFCGRGVCKVHAKEAPFLLAVFEAGAGLEGLAVETALWCGVCHPRPEPIPLDFLRPRPSAEA